ncbi:galactose mutarotase and related enzymes [Geminocystis sp. NIES-3708]|uniref:aldose epimerase family protein n=1 Tax=Geminocystis sp. NIES-3708 TaxID=1615909 RepID=UPI0005FC9951|nr:aldose epimerase [Geminocystis sp. NIES-3708]BAQ59790.1 galactose mutarotase and related enzymes [Geminocystis sp. NIES-3708]
MFNIAIKQEEYLTYILKDLDSNSRLEIVPEKGGIVTDWTIQGQKILYLDQERFKNPQLSVRGGIPILFPICGNLPDNIFNYQDQQYILKQHGFARDLPWKVISQSTDSSANIILSLKSNSETLKVYPFEFELQFTYKLLGKKLIIEQLYQNKSQEKMPFSVGFHPYFYCNDKNQLNLQIPATEYHNKNGDITYPFNGELDYSTEEIDIAFTQISEQKTSFADYKRNLKVDITFTELFSTLVFWTLKDKDYICLEPWSSPRNSINTGEQLKYLQPQEIHKANIIIEVF